MGELRKGALLLKSTEKKYYFNVSVCDGVICDYSREFYDFYKQLSKESRDLLDNYFSNYDSLDSHIDNPQVLELLSKYSKANRVEVKGYPIIYEEYHDIKGNRYGEELLTDKLFPIPKEVNDKFDVIKINKIGDMFRGDENIDQHRIFLRLDGKAKGYHCFEDVYNRLYYAPNSDDEYSYKLYPDFKSLMVSWAKDIGTIKKANVFCYRISKSLNFVHDNVNRLEVALGTTNEFANEHDINSYRSKNIIVKNVSRKVKKLFELNEMKSTFSNYSLNSIITSDILTLINNIENLLNQIKDINENLYQEANREYQIILDGNNNIENQGIDRLQTFYDNLSNKIKLPKENYKICELLDNYTKIVIDDIIAGKHPMFNIRYIASLQEEFVNREKEYDIKMIQTINYKFNLFYLLCFFSDSDYYNSEFFDLREIISTKINVRGIFNVIEDLKEKNIITYNERLKYYYLEKNFYSLLSFMKYISISDIEQIKALVKK